MSNAEDTPRGTEPTRKSDVDPSGVTVARYMAEHGIEGGIRLEAGDASAAAPPLEGNEKRKYEVGSEIAKGGMGAVLQAKDLNIRRTVAMKVMLGPKEAHPDKVLRFIEEAQVTGQLEHPSIVPVHELGVDTQGDVFYTMKFVRGVTLQAVLQQIRAGNPEVIEKYPLNHLLNVFLKACDAIAFAHTKGVIHRDCKPENIMVGDYGEVLVMDWGLAKVIPRGPRQGEARRSHPGAGGAEVVEDRAPEQGEPGQAESGETASREGAPEAVPSASTEARTPGATQVESVRSAGADGILMTREGQVMGTPCFMAPEQALGKVDELDERTDIYALGAILYNILTLRPPFGGSTVAEVLLKVAQGEIAPPTIYNQPETPSQRRAVLDPSERETVVSGEQAAQGTPGPTPRGQDRDDRDPLPHCPGNRVPAALSSVTMKALALDPDHRYQDVKELQADIEAHQGGFATSAEEAGAVKQLMLLMGRHKAECGLIAAAFLVILAVVATAFVEITAEKRDAVNARQVAEASAQEARAAKAEQARISREAAPEFLTKAKKLVDLKEWDRALAAARVAVGLDDSVAEAWALKGLLELGGQQLDYAHEALSRAQELAPPGTELHRRAKRQAGIAKQFLDLVSGSGGMISSDVTYALAKALEECEEFLISARLYAESGKARSGGMSLRMLAALKRLQQANPGLTRDSITVDESEPAKAFLRCRAEVLLDVAPLAECPLKVLDLSRTGVRDVSPLRSVPATALNLSSTRVTDITPLSDMPLTDLDLSRTKVTDLSALKGLPLKSLNLASTKVRDIGPLRGMPLRKLVLDHTQIDDLAPLQGALLEELHLRGARVTSIAALSGMPLKALNLAGANVRDLTPLLGMSLESLNVTAENVTDGMDAVRAMACARPVPDRWWAVWDVGLEFVWISALECWVGRYEVTNAQYRKFRPDHNSPEYEGYSLDGPDQPVTFEHCEDAVAFAAWLTERERRAGRLPQGFRYRLPTGKEWLCFAQCGDSRTYPWGADLPPPGEWNYHGQEGAAEDKERLSDHNDGYPVTCQVEESGRNDWGLYGVGGNAWECTSDKIESHHTLRGASWRHADPDDLRCAVRHYDPSAPQYRVGCRLVLGR